MSILHLLLVILCLVVVVLLLSTVTLPVFVVLCDPVVILCLFVLFVVALPILCAHMLTFQQKMSSHLQFMVLGPQGTGGPFSNPTMILMNQPLIIF